MQASFILVDTFLSSNLMDRDSSVDRNVKAKLLVSNWRGNNTSWYSQFELVILK